MQPNQSQRNPIGNYFNPTSNTGNNFWSTPVAKGLGSVQQAVQTPIPHATFANNVQNPVARFGASIPQSILNAPYESQQGAIGLGKNINQGTITPQNYLADSARAISLPLQLATLGAGSAATQLGKQFLTTGLKQNAITGAKYGGAYGLQSGLEGGRNTHTLPAYLANTGVNTALGAATGGALGGGSGIVGNKIASQINKQTFSSPLVKPKGQNPVQIAEHQIKYNAALQITADPTVPKNIPQLIYNTDVSKAKSPKEISEIILKNLPANVQTNPNVIHALVNWGKTAQMILEYRQQAQIKAKQDLQKAMSVLLPKIIKKR